ncbi:MAG: hypothetical protein ACLR8Y_12170 [Alistipes indistinctus]
MIWYVLRKEYSQVSLAGFSGSKGAFAPGRRIGSGRDGCSDCGVTRLIRGKIE